MPKVKEPKLTPKQAKFVKGKIAGKSGVQAAMDAYDTTDYNTANQIAVDNLQKPTIKQALEAEYARQGINTESVVEVLSEAMKATKPTVIGVGEYAEVEERTDHTTRLNAVRTAMTLIGVGKQSENPGVNVNFINVAKDDQTGYGV